MCFVIFTSSGIPNLSGHERLSRQHLLCRQREKRLWLDEDSNDKNWTKSMYFVSAFSFIIQVSHKK